MKSPNEQVTGLLAEIDAYTSDIARKISIEEERAGIKDASHFAYPTLAIQARLRRDKALQLRSEIAALDSPTLPVLRSKSAELNRLKRAPIQEYGPVVACVVDEDKALSDYLRAKFSN